jgi:peptide chain release factor 3
VQVFKPLSGGEYILGAVGVLQFDVTMERLKAEYGVAAVYEGVNYTTARWIECDNKKRLEEFQKKNQAHLAHDGEGHLTYLAASEWRLGHTMEEWEGITFLKAREHS